MPSTGTCGLCGRTIYDEPPDDEPDALNCGGDCGACVRDTENGHSDLPFEARAGRGPIIRTSRDLDQYMVWSVIADGPTYVGTRAELLALAATDETDAIRERLDRADTYGTSSITCPDGDGGYDGYGLIFDQSGWLLREHYAAFACAVLAEDEAGMRALITPFEDDHA